MDITALLIVTLVPWVTGFAWVTALLPPGRRPHTALLLGYGYFFGHYAVALLVFFVDRLAADIGKGSVLLSVFFLTLPAFLLLLRRGGGVWLNPPRGRSGPGHLLLLLLCCYGVMRGSVLFAEYALRPVYAWDAFKYWTLQALTWYQSGSISQWVWLSDTQSFAQRPQPYFSGSATHPLTVSLMSLWSMLASEQVHAPALNAQWLLAPVGMALVVYGSLRTLHYAQALCALGAFMLLSTPLLNVHAVLHGYADIWLAGSMLCATVAALHFITSRELGWLALMAASICMMLLTKSSGALFVLMAAVLVIAKCMGFRGIVIVASLSITTLLLLSSGAVGKIDIVLPGLGPLLIDWPDFQLKHYLFTVGLHNALPIFVASWASSANWHLGMLAYLTAVIAWGMRIIGHVDKGPLFAIQLSLVWLLIPFAAASLTDRYFRYFSDLTSTNRMLLAIYPVCLYALLLLLAVALQGATRKGPFNASTKVENS